MRPPSSLRSRPPRGCPAALGGPAAADLMWEAFLVSTGLVALGKMGDKTQLLALLLAARLRIRGVPIRWVHLTAPLLFAGPGAAVLAGVGS